MHENTTLRTVSFDLTNDEAVALSAQVVGMVPPLIVGELFGRGAIVAMAKLSAAIFQSDLVLDESNGGARRGGMPADLVALVSLFGIEVREDFPEERTALSATVSLPLTEGEGEGLLAIISTVLPYVSGAAPGALFKIGSSIHGSGLVARRPTGPAPALLEGTVSRPN